MAHNEIRSLTNMSGVAQCPIRALDVSFNDLGNMAGIHPLVLLSTRLRTLTLTGNSIDRLPRYRPLVRNLLCGVGADCVPQVVLWFSSLVLEPSIPFSHA